MDLRKLLVDVEDPKILADEKYFLSLYQAKMALPALKEENPEAEADQLLSGRPEAAAPLEAQQPVPPWKELKGEEEKKEDKKEDAADEYDEEEEAENSLERDPDTNPKETEQDNYVPKGIAIKKLVSK